MSPPPAVLRARHPRRHSPLQAASSTCQRNDCVAASPTRLRRVPPLRLPHPSRFRLVVHQWVGLVSPLPCHAIAGPFWRCVMDVRLRRGELADWRGGALALGILEGERTLDGPATAVDRRSRGALRAPLERGDFRGRFLETAVLYPSRLGSGRVILVGLGRRPQLTDHRLRQAAGLAARKARELGAGTLALVVPGAERDGPEAASAAQAVAEGALLGPYRFTAYRSRALSHPLKRVEIIERDAQRAKQLAPA